MDEDSIKIGGLSADDLITEDFEIAGLPVAASFSEEDVRDVFLPLLRFLSRRQKELGRRMFVFLAAPPGCGKSTLAAFLEKLSHSTISENAEQNTKELNAVQKAGGLQTTDALQTESGMQSLTPVQAVGMDGFHHRAAYLKSHTTVRDGRSILLDEIKGAPETFDAERLAEKLREARSEETLGWPVYSRTQHDVIEDAIRVTDSILLVEGNYLLLSSQPWKKIAEEFCDFSIYMYADENVLKKRLIERKIASGHTRAEAESFYSFSDGRNARLVLKERPEADLTLRCADGRYYGNFPR